MDKNKAAFKLQGMPHIYWLNLDADVQRREYMETQFDYWEITNHTRIAGYDGREDDVSAHLKGRIPDNLNQGELGCCMTHLKAIKEFYENTDDDYCIIAEDDVNFDTAKYWNFTWSEFFGLLPYDWDVVQMTTICTGDIHVKLHLKFINDFSAAFYLITRHHAAKVLRHHMRGNKWKLDNNKQKLNINKLILNINKWKLNQNEQKLNPNELLLNPNTNSDAKQDPVSQTPITFIYKHNQDK